MSVLLVDRGDPSKVLGLNLWNWRAIVAAVERLEVLSAHALSGLEPFCGGLERDEARRVAHALRSRLLSGLDPAERLMLDGTRTTQPDDGTFHRSPDEMHLNYSVPRDRLEAFARFCETCEGFDQ